MSTSERILATDQPLPAPTGTTTRPWASIGLVASTLLILMEVLRTLYPLGYALVGDLGFVVTPLVLLLVFLSPLLAIATPHLRRRQELLGAAAAIGTGRVVLQLVAPPGLTMVVIVTVVALAATTVVLVRALGRSGGALTVALGFVLAAGADACLKSVFATWDRVWQTGAWPLAVTLVVGAAPLLFALADRRDDSAAPGEPCSGRLGRMFSVAVLLMPTMMMVASVAYIGSSADASLPTAALATIGGAALAAMATTTAAAKHIGRRGALAAAAILAIVVRALSTAEGIPVIVLAVVGQCLVGVLLVGVLSDEPESPTRAGVARSALGATLGFVTMFALTLLHPLHYEMPLPISNTWLPTIAVALSAMGLLAARSPAPTGATASGELGWLRWAPALGMGVAAVGVAAALAMTASAERSDRAGDLPLVVASFNIDQAATESGSIDFRAAADQLDAIDADVIALQEVGRGWSLSGMSDFPTWLAQTRGEQLHFAPAADRQFGNALLSRVGIGAILVLPLPQGEGSMARSAIVADISTQVGQVKVIATHLQHRNSAAGIDAREQELQVILTTWAGAPRTIVIGDFNVDNQPAPDGGDKLLVGPDQRFTLQPLIDAGFTTTQPTERCTMPTSNDNCSDYVLVTPDLALDPPVVVLPPAPIGDHRPILGTVRDG